MRQGTRRRALRSGGALFAGGLLAAACAPQGDPGGGSQGGPRRAAPYTVRVQVWGDVQDQPVYDHILADFNAAHTDVRMENDHLPPGQDYYQKFAANLAELDPHEVPLNFLNPRPGTPFGDLDVLPASEALKAVAAFRLALPRTMLRFAGGREITLGDLGAKQGILGGINAVIVGNYLTTLGRPAEADLELLDDLQMPIKALNATI